MTTRIKILFVLATAIMWFGGVGRTQAQNAPKEILHKAHVICAIMVGEAGGEPDPGLQAVLNVIQNRAKGSHSIMTLYKHATKKWQFTAYNRVSVTKKMTEEQFIKFYQKHPAFKKAFKLVYTMVNGKIHDVTGNATHYYNPKKLKKAPYWAPISHGGKNRTAKFTTQIGQHFFFCDVD